MPLKNIPEEVRDEYEKIANRLKQENPKWSDEKRAKVAWTIIKQRYYKNKKTGKWVLKEKVKGWLENVENWMKMNLAKAVALEEDIMDKVRGGELPLLEAACDIVEAPDNFSLDILSPLEAAKLPMPPRKDPDILYMKQRLLHTAPYVNSNRFIFPVDDTVNAVENGQFEPDAGSYVDVNHDGNIYGWTLGAEIEDRTLEAGKVKAVNVYKLFLAYRYPEMAQRIKDAHLTGHLKASMSCHPEDIECSECGIKFVGPTAFYSHEHGSSGNLILHNPRFRASSIILPPFAPADKNTDNLQIAFNDVPETATDPVKPVDYVDYKKQKEEEKKQRKVENVPWRIVYDLSTILENILNGDYTNKFELVKKAYSDALQDCLERVGANEINLGAGEIDYIDYKKQKEEREKRRKNSELTWIVLGVLESILYNILDRDDITDKKGFIEKAFTDAFNDFIIQTGIKNNIQSAEDNDMPDEDKKKLTDEIASLKAKILEYEDADRNKVLKAKDDEIVTLKEQVTAKDTEIETLQTEKTDLESKIDGFTAKMEKFDEINKEYQAMKIEKTNAERKEKIEALGLSETKTKELIEKFEMKINEEGKIEGLNDDNFSSMIGIAADLKPKKEEGSDEDEDVDGTNAPDSAKVKDTEKKGDIPAGGKGETTRKQKWNKLGQS